MDIILLLIRLALAVVFGVAGVSKLADLTASRKAVAGFGVPERLANSVGWMLPVAEIITAVGLLFIESAWVAAIAALSLLGLFIIGISVNLVRGRQPDCNCFGQVHSEPISWTLVMRNLIFSALALLVIIQGKNNAGMDIFKSGEDFTVTGKLELFINIAILAVLAFIAITLKQLLNQQLSIVKNLEGLKNDLLGEDKPETITREDVTPPTQHLPVGAPAPEFALASLDGGEIALQSLLAKGNPLMLFFVSPTCSPCATLLPDLERWQKELADRFTFALISKGALAENQTKFADYGIDYVLLQNESEIADAYLAQWTPGAILVKADGVIGSQVAYGTEQIKKLFDHVTSLNETKPWFSKPSSAQGDLESIKPTIGDKAPHVELPDLAGNPVTLSDFFNKKTLLLFWSPNCGFCNAMLDEVKSLEARPANGTRLVIVSSGSAEQLSEQGLQSPILLDDKFKTGEAFGASGTPSAVLIDAEGKIASSVGVGEVEVLALAGVSHSKVAKQS
ncbi:MAG: redoxin domain-containing protein [Acidobacteriota bacterium]